MQEPSDDLNVPEILAALRSPSEEVREESLALLAEAVSRSFGADGEALGQLVRDTGGVAQLGFALADANPSIRQQGLLVLGNLCSSSVDSKSVLTKQVLLTLGAERALFANLAFDDAQSLVLTCATLQNLCDMPAWSEALASYGLLPRLAQLVVHEDPMVVRYASGTLRNVQVTLPKEEREAVSALISSLTAEASEVIKEREWEARPHTPHTPVPSLSSLREALPTEPPRILEGVRCSLMEAYLANNRPL